MGPHLVHLPESPVVPRSPCGWGQQVGRRKASGRGMLSHSQSQGLVWSGFQIGAVCGPASERLGVGLRCTKYCGRTTRREVGPSQSVYRDIAFKRMKTSFKIIKKNNK